MKNRKLSIAIILPSIITKNGTVKQSLELAKELRKNGHIVSFFTYAYLEETCFEDFRTFTINYCVNVEKSLIYKIISNVRLLETIYLYVALLQINTFRSLFNDKKINILNPHDWFGIWVAGGVPQSAIVAVINDVPLRTSGSYLNKLKLNIDRRLVSKISSIIVLDNINAKKVVKWLPITPEKVKIVRSGVDLAKYKNFKKTFDLRKKFNLSLNSYLIVCANLLARNRRYEDVLHAMAKINKNSSRSLHLFILSKLDFDKKYADFLKDIVKQLGLGPQVHFIDKFFSDEERMQYIKSADLLIFPNFPQTWGLTALEAMSLQVPVIVSSGSGVSEVLHHKQDSLIYEAGNVKELYTMIMLSMKNKALMRALAENAKKYVFNNFTWERYAKDVENVMIEATYNK